MDNTFKSNTSFEEFLNRMKQLEKLQKQNISFWSILLWLTGHGQDPNKKMWQAFDEMTTLIEAHPDWFNEYKRMKGA
jgi:hypothetical protein